MSVPAGLRAADVESATDILQDSAAVDCEVSPSKGHRFYSAASSQESSTASCKESCVDLTHEAESTKDVRNTDLDHFHASAFILPSPPPGSFTKVRDISACCRGEGNVELHDWSRPSSEAKDDTVVVKRVLATRVYANEGKETNERLIHEQQLRRHSEDVLSEIGVYGLLSQQNDQPDYILRMRTAFCSGPDVWLILDYCNGGDLFNVVQSLRGSDDDLIIQKGKRWMWQLIQAVSFLHKHQIAHRDISIENVLVKDEDLRLMDFGQAVSTHSHNGQPLRYFLSTGKPYYLAPECYVPSGRLVEVIAPEGSLPGSIVNAQPIGSRPSLFEVRLPETASPGQRCNAEIWGYDPQRADSFACGVCLFILVTGSPPWRQATLADPHFAWVHRQGIVKLLRSWRKMIGDGEDLLAGLINPEASTRQYVASLQEHPWFANLPEVLRASRQPPLPEASPMDSEAFDAAELDFGVANRDLVGDPYTLPEPVRSVSFPEDFDSPQPLPLLRSASLTTKDLRSHGDVGFKGELPISTCSDPYGWDAMMGEPVDLVGPFRSPSSSCARSPAAKDFVVTSSLIAASPSNGFMSKLKNEKQQEKGLCKPETRNDFCLPAETCKAERRKELPLMPLVLPGLMLPPRTPSKAFKRASHSQGLGQQIRRRPAWMTEGLARPSSRTSSRGPSRLPSLKVGQELPRL
eukprot:TRINITY_DN34457_c0_g1_i1.p1 TRINITY_DN34457_c0_g1~~TRINITY_DN34457_c0_g1_i1.p1  ORF type:complete len:690 (-),score=114.44 TRINITY_DN34457_c0_g1_i1:55-2124(-)